jgi:hypothetical protein
MPYATYNEVITRYPIIKSWGKTEQEITSHLIYYAEVELNGLLSSHFTVPFSDGYPTVKDITIDLAYYKALVTRDPEKAGKIQDAIMGRIENIQKGEEYIWTGSDTIQPLSAEQEVWSTTEDYHPVFGMHDAESVYSIVSSARLEAEEAERD